MANSLPVLPSLPSSSTRPSHPCACGCGRSCKGTFAPGHDARLKGGCVRVANGSMTLDQVAEVMGRPFADAVKRALANRALMARWQVEVPAVAKVG